MVSNIHNYRPSFTGGFNRLSKSSQNQQEPENEMVFSSLCGNQSFF